MNKEIQEKYIEAGKIASQARNHGATLVKEGAKAIDVVTAIENKIKELGGEIAFPTDLSINEMAAHYTPAPNDPLTIKAEDYVKLDVGAHVDGYTADTAVTVRPAGKDDLIICGEKALERVIKMFKPGVLISDIGNIIETTIKEFGFNPIRNLTGHDLDRYSVHAGVVIPNIKTTTQTKIVEGKVYAIEPFATPGAGQVKDTGRACVYAWMSDRVTRNIDERKVLDFAKNKMHKLPFAPRQVGMDYKKLEIILAKLVKAKALHPYYPLVEVSGKPVSQAEHTIIALDKPIVTTR